MWKWVASLAVVVGLGSAVVAMGGESSPDAGRLDVSRTWGQDGGRIASQAMHDGKQVLHGLQVVVGPKNWLKEYAVYNLGVFEQATQFYPSGRTFREQRREHNGDGSDVVYEDVPTHLVAQKVIVDGGADIGPIKTQTAIAQGMVKNDRRWSGTFLVPTLEGFATKLMLQEFRDGKIMSSTPFPVEKLGLPEGHREFDTWLWAFPEWPVK